jgi:hypothetical protein
MANKKITELDALTTPAGADVLAIVDDVAGTATTKQVTVTNLMAAAPQGDLEAANNLSDLNDAATARTNLGIGTAATSASTDFSPAFFSTVSDLTTARTLSNSDNGKVIVCTNASTITVTIPNSLTAGFSCKLVQGGAGLVNVIAASGTTLSLIGGKNFTSIQYQVVDLINYGTELYVLDSVGLQVDPTAWSNNTYSLSFDGSNDLVSFTQTTFSDGARTFSAWVNFPTISSVIYPILGGSSDRWGYNPSNGYMYLGDSGNVHYGLIGACSAGAWVHLFVTQSTGGTLTFYKDGGTGVTATGAGSGAGDLVFDSQGKMGSTYMAGKIDEIAIWDSDQTSNFSTIYSGGSADDLSTLNPVHWWRNGDFEGGTGGSVNDQGSDGSLDGTINGATFDGTDAP